jgi:hypothetical protein
MPAAPCRQQQCTALSGSDLLLHVFGVCLDVHLWYGHSPNALRIDQGGEPWRMTPADVMYTKRASCTGAVQGREDS